MKVRTDKVDPMARNDRLIFESGQSSDEEDDLSNNGDSNDDVKNNFNIQFAASKEAERRNAQVR